MKKLANLKGAKALNKSEQKSIHGGFGGRDCTCFDGCLVLYPLPSQRQLLFACWNECGGPC